MNENEKKINSIADNAPSTTKGRPSKYTEENIKKICSGLIEGKSLVAICKEIDVGYSTVAKWLTEDDKKDFVEKYTRAREAQADYYFDEIVTIADTAEDANKARLQIDARKWAAGKLRPKKYGDKIDVDANIKGNVDNTLKIEFVGAKNGRTE